ncbi:COG4223 family protein [Gymnodinialimonas sp.]
MAKKSSTRSGRQKSQDDSVSPESVAAETVDGAGEMGGDTVVLGDDTLGEDAVAVEATDEDRVTVEPGDTTAAEGDAEDPAQTEIVEAETVEDTVAAEDQAQPAPEAQAAPEAEPAPEPEAPAPTPAPAPVIEQRGPGMGALLIGGVVAAALGYGAAVFGLMGGEDTSATDTALAEAMAAIEAQQGTITALEAEVAALSAVEPPVIPEVDLSGVEGAIAGVASDVAGVSTTIEALTGRIVSLEERPIFTGDVSADTAEMTEALEAIEARIAAEQAAAAEAIAEAEAAQAAAAEEAAAAAEAAEAAIAEAEAQAAAEADAAQTQSVISQIQAAVASGAPFADALAALPGDAPEALAATAEAGVPTMEDLQAAFPAAARAALPIALRETAGDSATDRAAAFLLGQIGGRSVEPREGDDPDAVLSRAEAAVAAGDLETALTEIAALPEGAQAMLNDWVGQVETRAAADAALAELSATLEN